MQRQVEIIKIMEQKERKMDAYNKAKTANNSALYTESIRLTDDNKRLKGNITTILMSTTLGIMSGRV